MESGDIKKKISVIMPVNLGYYKSSATYPEYKFMRSVNSFLAQSFKNAELIIISDGCKKAEMIYMENYIQQPSVRFEYIEKQILFSGVIRQTGIDMAEGEIICYLDHDDLFGKEHLATINKYFNTDKYDWVYYNDYLIRNISFGVLERKISPVPCQIGTSCIAHKRSLDIHWVDGYGHDWELIRTYLFKRRPGIKIPTPQYYVCHCPGLMDF